jgi:hypothetical protein
MIIIKNKFGKSVIRIIDSIVLFKKIISHFIEPKLGKRSRGKWRNVVYNFTNTSSSSYIRRDNKLPCKQHQKQKSGVHGVTYLLHFVIVPSIIKLRISSLVLIFMR